MKKLMLFLMLGTVVLGVAACKTCETEPIVEQNHKLVVPPNFGNKPA